MAYYYSKTLKIPFDDVVLKISENLKQQGFGVITTIDVKEVLKQKLNLEFRKYRILGACNPEFAHKAISLESHIGVMLPCNVVIQDHENGEVEVSAISPLETFGKATSSPQLKSIATEISNRLRAALDDLHRKEIEPGHEELNPASRSGKTSVSGKN